MRLVMSMEKQAGARSHTALVSQVTDFTLFRKNSGKPLYGFKLVLIKGIADCWAESVLEVIWQHDINLSLSLCIQVAQSHRKSRMTEQEMDYGLDKQGENESGSLLAEPGQWEESGFPLNKPYWGQLPPITLTSYLPFSRSTFSPRPSHVLNPSSTNPECAEWAERRAQRRQKSSKGRDFSAQPQWSLAVPWEWKMKAQCLLQGLESVPLRGEMSSSQISTAHSRYTGCKRHLTSVWTFSGLHAWANLPMAATLCGANKPFLPSTIDDKLQSEVTLFSFPLQIYYWTLKQSLLVPLFSIHKMSVLTP